MNFNKYVIALLLIAVLFLIYTLFLFILKEKSIELISGFNLKSDEEQRKYDIEAIVKNIKIKLFTTSVIFITGAAATLIFGKKAFYIFLFLGLAFVIKIAHFNPDKAYEKYLKKENKGEQE